MLSLIEENKIKIIEDYDELLDNVVDHEVLFPITLDKEYIKESVELVNELAEKTKDIVALAESYEDVVDEFKNKIEEYKAIAENPYIIGQDRSRRMNRIREMYYEFRPYIVESLSKLSLRITEEMPENVIKYIKMAENSFNDENYILGIIAIVSSLKDMLTNIYKDKIGNINSKKYPQIINEIVSKNLIENGSDKFKEAIEIYNRFMNNLEYIFMNKEKAELIIKHLVRFLVDYYE